MNQSQSISKLAAALVAAQAEMKSVPKDASNLFFKSKYATLDAIIEAGRPILARHELAIVQGATTPHTDERGFLRTITLETMLIHSSGEWLSNGVVIPVATTFDKDSKNEVGPTAQTAGQSITYGRRYGVGALLSITTDEDIDGNSPSQNARPTRARPRNAESYQNTAKAVADSADGSPITRNSLITFGSLTGTPIRELKDSYLQWGLEDGRNFGPRTAEWQKAFRDELTSRDSTA